MAVFKSVITDLGAEILTDIMAEGGILTIDSVVIGDGRYGGYQVELLDVVSPIEILSKISNREFIPKTDTQPSYLQITIDILNAGLTQSTPVREIGLFSGDIMFAYSWLDGDDTDNIIPIPINPEFSDTVHSYDINLFITGDENANINISFSLTVADNELVKSMSERIGQPEDVESATGRTLFSLIRYVVKQFTGGWATTIENIYNFLTKSVNSSPETPLDMLIFNHVEIFSTPGTFTWTKKAGQKYARVIVIGGGGSSVAAGSGGFGSGGGGSGFVRETIIDISAVSSVMVSVGNTGGTSSFGAYLSATGGVNGTAGGTVAGLGGLGGVNGSAGGGASQYGAGGSILGYSSSGGGYGAGGGTGVSVGKPGAVIIYS